MTYAQIDLVADSYIPILLCMIFLYLSLDLKSKNFLYFFALLVRSIACVCVVYVMMFIDIQFSIFHRYDLDYSTHTALSSALLTCLVNSVESFWMKIVYFLSLNFYFFIMIFQKYHSLADIFFTLLLVLPCFQLCMQLRKRIKVDG